MMPDIGYLSPFSYLNITIRSTMKNPLLYILIPAGFLLVACPYETAVPISKPEVNTNHTLSGTWQDAIDTTTTYKVSEQNKFYYKILEAHNDGSEGTTRLMLPLSMEAHSSISGRMYRMRNRDICCINWRFGMQIPSS